MSSSLPAARFATILLSRDKAGTPPVAEGMLQAATEVPDETLLAQIAIGDQEALATLFRRYAPLVWSVAEKIVRNKAEADDLLQDVFLLIQRRASVFDGSKGTARSLIVHMTYQRALSRRRYLSARHYQAPKEAEEKAARVAAPAAPLYDESIEAHFGRERLREALDEMSEEQRETLRLYFFEGYSLGEIAERLGQSLGNVRHHYFRGLDRLRMHLPGKGSGEWRVASEGDERKAEQARNSITTTKRRSPDLAVERFPRRESRDGNGKEQRQLLGMLYRPEYCATARLGRVPRGSF